MAMRPQMPELDSKKISEFLTNMKKQMAQVDGEMTMMKNDAQSSLFQNFAQMINQVFQAKEMAEHKVAEAHKTLEEIYQGHPEIQIQIEAKAKEQQAAIDKKNPKTTIVKKGKN